jgi:hypothetical protein
LAQFKNTIVHSLLFLRNITQLDVYVCGGEGDLEDGEEGKETTVDGEGGGAGGGGEEEKDSTVVVGKDTSSEPTSGQQTTGKAATGKAAGKAAEKAKGKPVPRLVYTAHIMNRDGAAKDKWQTIPRFLGMGSDVRVCV